MATEVRPNSARWVVLAGFAASALLAQTPSADQLAFFETNIRPVLVKNCQVCHNEAKASSGFSVESRESLLRGGNRGEGKTTIIAALKQTGELKMPPGGKLRDAQVEAIGQWLEMGAPWPVDAEVTRKKANRPGLNHWAFKAPVAAEPPQVKNAAWARNAIDRFILARLEKEGMQPSTEAPRAAQIRRLSLDLTGIPPTPEEVDAFLADRRPDAYEQVIDRLLASPHYGEKWARHWLDGARYADTNGYGSDSPRVMWHWRDWVINALNKNMPFDQFTIEQLAGDMLPGATVDQKIATGFHRNTMINEEGGTDQEQFRVESVFDRVQTTGALFLGLTVGCAQCHDHKYDPISQREFYSMFSFFNQQDEPIMRVVPNGEAARYQNISASFAVERLKLEQAVAERAAELVTGIQKWEISLTKEHRAALPGNVRDILAISPERRTVEQLEDLEKHHKEVDEEYQRRTEALSTLASTPNAKHPNQFTAMVLAEREKPRQSWVLIGGDFLRHGVAVRPETPAVLPPLKVEGRQVNRLDLARWLVSPEHPLTARVTMNRIWQHYFGKGLVKTSEDFGTQGDLPTHPELLDWLALEFQRQKWSIKAMHRLIVTSAVYRQSSQVKPEHIERDADNVLLARFPRVRVEAEFVRDIALAASGLLDRRVGGPSVFAPQPPKVTDLSRGNLIWVDAKGSDRYRRGMYTYWKRTSPYPTFATFDAPSAEQFTVRRTRSNTPLQALTLLNEQVFVEAAQELAERMRTEAVDDSARLRRGFRLTLSREPDGVEKDALSSLLAQERKTGASEEKAWFAVARTLLSLDETITRE